MPRDSGGNYSLPAGNPVTSGTVITSTWANTTMSDVATALTDSLDRQGRGGMLAPFLFSDGTAANPGAAWSNEPTSGVYRAGAGDLRMSILTDDIMRWQNGQASIWTGTAWAKIVGAGESGSVPDGAAEGETLYWDATGTTWAVSTGFTVDATGNINGVAGTFSGLLTSEGLDAGAGNVVTTGDVTGAFVFGDGSNLTNLPVQTTAWGTITGTLSAQTDLQAALDAKLSGVAWGIITGTLSDQTDLQAALDAKADETVSFSYQTGVSYTLVLSDAGKLVNRDNAAANTLTIPPNSSVAFPTGTRIEVDQLGAGQTTIVAGAGVTINSADSLLALRAQYSGATLTKLSTNSWLLVGDLA